MIGARQGVMSGIGRLVAAAMARDLHAFVVPGADVARAAGLDLGAAGLCPAMTPRHANVLLVVGPLPAGLQDAASVAYSQMPRPRTILALGAGDLGPLPAADATGPLTQGGLVTALADLRRIIAAGAFRPEVQDFDAPALQTRTEYTCPMHPEVTSDQPGNCPKCGMTLEPREAAAGSPHAGHTMAGMTHAAPTDTGPEPGSESTTSLAHHTHTEAPPQYTCPMHPEVISGQPGNCPKCGMTLVPAEAKADHAGHDHAGHQGHAGHHHAQDQSHDHTAHTATEAPPQYTCPMHPEVISGQPGNCPKCGMTLVPAEAKADHAGHDHAGHQGHAGHGDHSGHGGHGGHSGGAVVDGIEPHFMSMADLTRDLPASSDGLRMDWVEAPFGPFFPGLPGGLGLTLTLDGDMVADARGESRVGGSADLADATMAPDAFVEHLAALSPLSPVAYRLLACLALERAAGIAATADIATARAAAVERERIASHLGWLAGLGAQTGMVWLERRAAALQLALRGAAAPAIAAAAPNIAALLRRVRKTPLLATKLTGIGLLTGGDAPGGPVARASGSASDARSGDPVYDGLGFSVLSGLDGDALARLHQRLDEITQSLALIARAGDIALPVPADIGVASGSGEALVETPRGAARLTLTLASGTVTDAEIAAPAAAHLALIGVVAGQQELGDALTALGSLDISPWEMTA